LGSTRTWLLLVVVQIGLLALLAAVGPTVSETSPLRYVGLACAAGVFVCFPPLVLKLFVAAQARIGNGALPMVRFVADHQAAMILAVWAMIGAALAMAMPTIVADIRAEREAAATPTAAATEYTIAAAAAPPSAGGAGPVTTAENPAAGSPERTAILNALRQRLHTRSRFRVDHLRVAGRWAFVRATEEVELDRGEAQETDLSVAALLEHPAGSTRSWWRITELWTLPDERERPLADFARRVRQRVRAEGLPAGLLPDDL
jgi:hypothetical protein